MWLPTAAPASMTVEGSTPCAPPQGGTAILLERPAQHGVWGAALDFARVAAGVWALGHGGKPWCLMTDGCRASALRALSPPGGHTLVAWPAQVACPAKQ